MCSYQSCGAASKRGRARGLRRRSPKFSNWAPRILSERFLEPKHRAQEQERYGGFAASVNHFGGFVGIRNLEERSVVAAPRGSMICSVADMHWDYIVILLFLGAIAPILGYFRVRRLMQVPFTTSLERLALYASTIAVQWVIVGVILWSTAVHGLAPRDLGLVLLDGKLTASVAVLLSLLLLANQIFSIRKLAANPQEIKGMIAELALKIFPQSQVERLAFVALVVTVAICEELIYRGFVQGLFQHLGGSILAGIFGSALFFAAAHVYQGRRGLISTFIVGTIFATVRWWTGNLLPSVCAHFAADLAAGLYAPEKLRSALAAYRSPSTEP